MPAYCFGVPTMVRKPRPGDYSAVEEMRLRELARQGLTQREAASALGRSYASVRHKSGAMRLTWAKRHKGWSWRGLRTLRELAKTHTYEQVAAVLGRSWVAVMQKARRHNISFVKRGEDHPAAKLTRDQVGQVFDLHARGWSQRKIAARFGVDHSCIGAILNFETRYSESLPMLHAQGKANA